jgi:uncharacterized phage protein (TIGR01671 family)
MREIKFRAWDPLNKRWIRIWSLKLNIDGSILAVTDIVDLEMYGTHQVKVLEYTGLKDKNGKDIYEGDVLENGQYTHEPVVVIWDSGTCSYDLQTGDGSEQEHLLDTSGEADLGYVFWEIIGNIYENPELLKEGVDVEEK